MKSTKQFIKFGLTGLLNTVLTYVIYLLLLQPTNATFAMGVGYGITSLIGLSLNNKWVFKTHGNLKLVVIKYYATYLFTWLISIGIAHIASSSAIINSQLIPLVSLMITVPTNFLLSKFWVFNNKKQLREAHHLGS
ncbi:GtrA family protein [Lentilactobacillus sp. G22-6]|uniref:GtrA family protein n=1 Tax=Lentilactobacillus TaxID=2767893 RepID=UPI001C253885|nr:GtrA family protein [Lentilactobacillus dabitei]